MDTKKYFLKLKNVKIEKEVPLSYYTTFRIGGAADLLIKVTSQKELVETINICREHNIPFIILGGGSNVLINDNGFQGVVILDRTSDYSFYDEIVTANSGTFFRKIAFESIKRGLEGIEFGCCLYGTLGGAIYGNSGAYGKSIGDVLIEAEILKPDGKIELVDNNFFHFQYRDSSLKTNLCVVLSVKLKLQKSDPIVLLTRVKEDIEKRLNSHPQKEGSAGSYFKNLPSSVQGEPRIPAGKILDELGARG
ncbi:MAG: FAD-binding protein, partial [Candidatus Hydrogenedentota bacterium]